MQASIAEPDMSRRSRVRKRRRKVLLLTGGVASYWIVIFLLTHIPLPREQKLSQSWLPHADKWVHAAIYAGLAFLLMWLLTQLTRSLPKAGLLTLTVVVFYGVVDELLQGLVPSRDPDLGDFAADVAGAVAGSCGFVAARKLWRRLRGR